MTILNNAKRIDELEPDKRVAVIAALLTLARKVPSGRFLIVIDGDTAKLEDTKYPGDYYCEGSSVESLTAVIRAFEVEPGPRATGRVSRMKRRR